MSGDVQVRICERLGVRFPRATRLIITGSSKELLENEVKPLVEAFLAERGLQLSPTKTVITHISEGFDFLGQNVRKYGDKLLIKPSAKNVKTFLDKVRETIRVHRSSKQEILINLLNPMIRGWANYHRHVAAGDVRGGGPPRLASSLALGTSPTPAQIGRMGPGEILPYP